LSTAAFTQNKDADANQDTNRISFSTIPNERKKSLASIKESRLRNATLFNN